jgi:UDPglucose 6-dehydrogenase
MNIGIIGYGFVGKALEYGFKHYVNIKIFDKYNNVFNTLEETVNDSSIIFVGVPTPMKEDGSQDLSNMADALKNIDKVAKTKKIIVLKSTIVPGTTRMFANIYPQHDFIFNPEFLTEKNANEDFVNSTRIVLGGDKQAVNDVEKLYRIRFEAVPIFKTTLESAELVKYMGNCFLAMKVSFCNEFYDIAQFLNIDYDELKEIWVADGRMGNSHISVPGPDGHRGYGGKCFVKDINALIAWAEENGLNVSMCRSAESVNNKVRDEKDWKNIVGATSINNYSTSSEDK